MTTAERRHTTFVDHWWTEVAAHRLLLRRCLSCATQWLPWTPYCPDCGPGPDAEWAQASGRGSLYSWVGVHHSASSPGDVPFTVASVRLEEGAMLYGRLSHPDRALRGDEPVRVVFEQRDGRTVVGFTTADGDPGWE